MTRYGVTTDYEYSSTHKRERLLVWSGPFASVFEAQAYSLPKQDGYMLTTYHGAKIRVSCPCPRTDENYPEVDNALTNALRVHFGEIPQTSIISLAVGETFTFHAGNVPCTYLGSAGNVYKWRAYDGEHFSYAGTYKGNGKRAWPFVHPLTQVSQEQAAKQQERTRVALEIADRKHRQEA
jgi:hypothetical protein